MIGPVLPKGRTYKKLVERYNKKGNKQLEKAIKNEMFMKTNFSIPTLKSALKNLKKSSMYKGKISGLKKNEMLEILNNWNYDLSTLPTKPRKTGGRPKGSKKI